MGRPPGEPESLLRSGAGRLVCDAAAPGTPSRPIRTVTPIISENGTTRAMPNTRGWDHGQPQRGPDDQRPLEQAGPTSWRKAGRRLMAARVVSLVACDEGASVPPSSAAIGGGGTGRRPRPPSGQPRAPAGMRMTRWWIEIPQRVDAGDWSAKNSTEQHDAAGASMAGCCSTGFRPGMRGSPAGHTQPADKLARQRRHQA